MRLGNLRRLLSMSVSNPLPIELYESLLAKLIKVIELTQQPEGVVTPLSKQAVLQATNDYKNSIGHAKEIATNLSGGQFLIEDQDEVIRMLNTLRDRKREQLARFAAKSLVSARKAKSEAMDYDSVASTPFNE